MVGVTEPQRPTPASSGAEADPLSKALIADYVAPVHPRRPVRFFAYRIPEDGQIWLDGTAEIVGVEHVPDGWTVLVKEEGQVQTDG